MVIKNNDTTPPHIILLNIVVSIIVFIFMDFIFVGFIRYKVLNEPFTLNVKEYISYMKVINFDNYYKHLEHSDYFRDSIKPDTPDNKSILIFGCSFGYGWLLNKEQSFSYKLSNLTNRTVYNRSISSLGLQYFPYIMDKFNIENTIKEPEYIIFVFIDNHVYRLYRYFYEDVAPYKDIRYKFKDGKLYQVSDKNHIFDSFEIVRYFLNRYSELVCSTRTFDENFDFMKQHFLLAKKIASKKFPNSKLVILKFQEMYNSELYSSERWKELENEGYIILDTYSLTGKELFRKEYRIENDVHPNEYAWDILTPKIVEKLNL